MGKNVYMLYGMTNFTLDRNFISANVKINKPKINSRIKYENLKLDIKKLIHIIESEQLLNNSEIYRLTDESSQEAHISKLLNIPTKNIYISNDIIASKIEDFKRQTYTFNDNINPTNQLNSWEKLFNLLACYEYLVKSNISIQSNPIKQELISNFYFNCNYNLYGGEMEKLLIGKKIMLKKYLKSLSNSSAYPAYTFFEYSNQLVEISKELNRINIHYYLHFLLTKNILRRLNHILHF